MKVKLFERQYIKQYIGSGCVGCAVSGHAVLEPLEAFESRVNEFLFEHPGNVHFIDKNTIYIYQD